MLREDDSPFGYSSRIGGLRGRGRDNRPRFGDQQVMPSDDESGGGRAP